VIDEEIDFPEAWVVALQLEYAPSASPKVAGRAAVRLAPHPPADPDHAEAGRGCLYIEY
jgi:hypothetical protein